jgi:F-type H+-transporting ATPase subunit delta
MQTAKHARRDAKELFRLCLTGGALDESKVRRVVQGVIASGRHGTSGVLSRFLRLVRLDSARRRVTVESAVLMPVHTRARLEAAVTKMYGASTAPSFAVDVSLIGGVRITAGSDVYDGSVKGQLAALESQF